MKRPLLRLMAAGLLTVGISMGAPSYSDPDTSFGKTAGQSGNLTMVTHNISGGNPNMGSASAADAAIYHIRTSIADAAALQEVCGSQVSYIRAQLPQYQVFFDVTKPGKSSCPGDNNLGNVILVHDTYPARPQVETYHQSTGSRMMCATFWKHKPVVACSIHVPFSLTDAERYSAMNNLRTNQLLPWYNGGWSIAVAGDFNTKPDSTALNPIYAHVWESDQFRGCATGCRAGRATHMSSPTSKRKFDYIFFSTNFSGRTDFNTALSGWPSTSQHRILKSTTPIS